MAGKFGETLRALRIKRKLRLKDVAQAMGWSVVYLSDLERGHRNPPKPEVIAKLARVLNVPAGELLAAASEDKRHVELPLETSPSKREVALLLARTWDELTDEEARKIVEILKRR
ncbi:MAG TPA: XRE family transcriptional regulator [Thermosulfurimonas dismutans]|uniref:XRE family transcriptional regulator n=1 Tax=Thermosulfurimonas dismutans TaxID=999894 RepID=A0A7C3CJU3_9BACT|nr:XRE family transcriptional regulator [Thermosulfurimonas dismutans]